MIAYGLSDRGYRAGRRHEREPVPVVVPRPLVSLARHLARRTRGVAARALAPGRRAVATARIRRTCPIGTIVFVCYGNICRSPYAAAALARALPDALRGSVRISSAGLFGPGRPSPDVAVASAAARGIDLALHESRLLTAEDCEPDALILVMEPQQRRGIARQVDRECRPMLLGDLALAGGDRRAIIDPYGRPPTVFDAVYARIDVSVRRLAKALESRTSPPNCSRTVAPVRQDSSDPS